MMVLVLSLALGVESTVTLPLSAYEAIEAPTPPVAPSVRMGRAVWNGVVDASGAVEVEADLVVDLDGDGWKSVPLLGAAAVLKEVRIDGTPVPVTLEGGHHVWTTDAVGPVVVHVDAWIPSSGQPGSLEYDVAIPQTPSTRLVLTLPQPDLRPEVRDAVRTDVRSVGDQTVLTADLQPTTRLHVLGLRDLQSDDARPAELYAESSHLVSIDDHRVDVFSVVRFSILYAGTRRFDLFVPDGLTVVEADGEGAFRYDLEPVDGGTLLRGETRHPIRNRYEVSLRVQQALPEGDATLRLPEARGVEREHGWVGLEVPGRVQVTERRGVDLHALQIQQLPAEVRESSLSPILDAWRLDGGGTLAWTAAPLPEVEVSSERVDQVVARTVMAGGGRTVTELTMTLHNRSRHGLTLTLPEGTEVTSASRDGQPVVPAARDGGVVLPLRRTDGRPQVLRVVLASSTRAPGLFGVTELALPPMDLPLAAVDWQLHLPEGRRWGDVESDVRSQTRAGNGSWLADRPQLAVQGTPPSAVAAPESGEVRRYGRFWVDGGDPIAIRVRHTAPWLAALVRLMLGLGVVGALGLFVRGRLRE